MARDPNRRSSSSVVFPILLIAFGALFLYAEYRPDFDPFATLWSYRTYWPLILIFIGLGKIWDYTRARQQESAQDPSSGSAPARSIGTTVGVIAFILLLVVILWRGSNKTHGHGFGIPMRHDVHTLDAQGAKSVRGKIEMGAGSLNITGNTAHLLDAAFDYRESYGPPDVDYNVSDGVGELNVNDNNTGTHILGGDSRNTWNLRFGSQVPLALSINMGAGEGRLRLRDLPLTKLELNMGAGRIEADLTGDRKEDLNVDIQGGVGEAVIRLPKNVGVIATVSGGLGAVDTRGLKHDGDEYINDAYGHTPATIHLRVEGGVGRINLVQEP